MPRTADYTEPCQFPGCKKMIYGGETEIGTVLLPDGTKLWCCDDHWARASQCQQSLLPSQTDLFLASDSWKILRRLALERTDHRCPFCGRTEDEIHAAGEALEVHHIVYDRWGGRERLEELTSACTKDHRHITRLQQERGRRTDPR